MKHCYFTYPFVFTKKIGIHHINKICFIHLFQERYHFIRIAKKKTKTTQNAKPENEAKKDPLDKTIHNQSLSIKEDEKERARMEMMKICEKIGH